jgi:hypothetical protein
MFEFHLIKLSSGSEIVLRLKLIVAYSINHKITTPQCKFLKHKDNEIYICTNGNLDPSLEQIQIKWQG